MPHHHRPRRLTRAAVTLGLAAAAVAARPAIAQAKIFPTVSQGVAWGANASGQLGDGSPYSNWVYTDISGLTGVSQLSAGQNYGLAAMTSGQVYAWGDNSYGQLGSAVGSYTASPAQVPGLSQVTSIAAGAFFALAVETHGYVAFRNYVYAWGQNVLGTLGNGTACPFCGIPTPEPVNGINVPEVASIAAGPELAMAVATR